MAEPKVFFVHLRRPGRDDRRDDPFYEFGSFGCTKCHSKNLMHPAKAEELRGARLAFIQGGHLGSRLVFLTPTITVQVWKDNCEARWKPWDMPFKYAEAPILVWHDRRSDFSMVRDFVSKTRRPTDESRLSSKFRSRKSPLSPELAQEVVEVYERLRAGAPDSAIALTYDEALPWQPPIPDRNREATYRSRISELAGDPTTAESVFHADMLAREGQAQSHCGLSRRRQSEGQTKRCR